MGQENSPTNPDKTPWCVALASTACPKLVEGRAVPSLREGRAVRASRPLSLAFFAPKAAGVVASGTPVSPAGPALMPKDIGTRREGGGATFSTAAAAGKQNPGGDEGV